MTCNNIVNTKLISTFKYKIEYYLYLKIYPQLIYIKYGTIILYKNQKSREE